MVVFLNSIISILLVYYVLNELLPLFKKATSKVEKAFLITLFIIHFGASIAFLLLLDNLPNNDAIKYYNAAVEAPNWLSLFSVGGYIVSFLIYPLVKIKVSIAVLFLVFATISFKGFLIYFELLNFKALSKKVLIIFLFFLIPSIHFWTGFLGKEALLFLLMALVLKHIKLMRFTFRPFKLNTSSIRVIFDKKLYRELLSFNKIAILDSSTDRSRSANFKPKKAENSLELTKFNQNEQRKLKIVDWKLLLYVGFIFLIRPHVFFILLLAFLLIFMFEKEVSRALKRKVLLLSIVCSVIALPIFFRYFLKIDTFSISAFQDFFEGLARHGENSGNSKIDLMNTSIFSRIFYLILMPLPFLYDIKNSFQWVTATENSYFLLIFIFSIYFFIKNNMNFKSLKIDQKFAITSSLLLMVLFGAYLYNLGLGNRMRIMFFPYLFYFLITTINAAKENEKETI
jgi:hypothetical protein